MADETLDDAIRTAALSPAKASGDEGSVEARTIDELIKADRHLASKQVASGARRGFRLTPMKPPGTV